MRTTQIAIILFSGLFLTALVTPDVRAQGRSSAPSALTTAGGPPVKAAKKEKGALLKKVLPPGLQSGINSVSGLVTDSTGRLAAPSLSELTSETMPDLGLKVKQLKKRKDEFKEALREAKQKRMARTDYEGIGITRMFNKIGSGDRTIEEEFYVLKEYRKPSTFVRDFYWYDEQGNRVTNAVPKDREQSEILILHGPYKRYANGTLTDEGFYYLGAKDGRWEKYDQNFMLLDKSRWHRGFPADARIAYYDSSHTKIKEVIPVEYGKIRGTYMAFHENGRLAEEGKFENGVKIGRWTEYHPNTTRQFRRKLTQYARDQWEEGFEPYVISEWDEKGKMTYERPKEKTVVEEADDN